MSSQPDNFDPLRRLLALKRHEQPPPGFFDGFSRQVVLRIRTGETGSEGAASLFWDAPWLQRLWSLFEAKPLFAGALGVAACGVMIAGVIMWDPGNYNLQSSNNFSMAIAPATEAHAEPMIIAGIS